VWLKQARSYGTPFPNKPPLSSWRPWSFDLFSLPLVGFPSCRWYLLHSSGTIGWHNSISNQFSDVCLEFYRFLFVFFVCFAYFLQICLSSNQYLIASYCPASFSLFPLNYTMQNIDEREYILHFSLDCRFQVGALEVITSPVAMYFHFFSWCDYILL
jgi:hypothetical protein